MLIGMSSYRASRTESGGIARVAVKASCYDDS